MPGAPGFGAAWAAGLGPVFDPGFGPGVVPAVPGLGAIFSAPLILRDDWDDDHHHRRHRHDHDDQDDQ